MIVDRELLDALGFDAATPLEVRVVNGTLSVARADRDALTVAESQTMRRQEVRL